MDYGLSGKVAVISGAGGAICGEGATGLAREGAKVAIWDLRFEAASKKAAVINFTQWLAVHMAQNYSPCIRVNALAPGFIR